MFLFVLVAFSKDKKTETKFNKVVKEKANDYSNVKEKTKYVIWGFFAEEFFLQMYFIYCIIFSLKRI